jgi:hypothetical protein
MQHAIETPTAVQPPGTEALNQLLQWGAWGVSFACLAGIMIVAATLALRHRRGEAGENAGQLGVVMAAAVLGAAAGPIVTALT